MSERPRRFTEVIAMLTSIDKDDSGGKSETEEGDVLDCQLCSSGEMSDDEKTEQFDNAQPIVHIDDLQTSDTNVEIYSATYYNDDSGSGAAKSSSTNETARDGIKWEFMEFGLKLRGRRAAQNVLTEQSGLSCFALRRADSPVGAFQIIFDNHIPKYIQQCTNVEA